MDADKALELAIKAFPNDIEFRTAYMLGLNEGYELHRDEMMKEAVESEVWNYSSNEDLRAIPIWGINKFRDLKDGDRVKIIIIKED